MRVLITGAGEVGFLVASELYPDHDVIVIDKDPSACARLKEMDVKVLQGNAADARLLINAGLKKTDIVVAVTGNDEVNVITCIIASHLGVRQTIARVSNPEYIDRPVQHRKEIGISYMICPELVLAEDMARSLLFSSMLMNRELAGGRVELIEFKVTWEMKILGPLRELILPNNCNLIAINRAGEIFIPSKDDEILLNDHLMLLCDPSALPNLRKMLHETQTSAKVMIVGGGTVGFYLASRLIKMGVDIKLIEVNVDRCRDIAETLSNTTILNGDGSDLALLKEEAAGEADAVFAVTGLDDKNLLCSLLVKQLGARKVLTRVNRSDYIKLFEKVGIDRAISPGQVMADVILQRVIGGEEVITLSDQRIELIDFIANAKARIIGKRIAKELPNESMVGMVLRGGNTIIPGDDFRIEEGDRVFVISMPSVVSKVKKLFVS